MPVDSLHEEYKDMEDEWNLVRDSMGGERAIKAAGDRYVRKLQDQTDTEHKVYIARGSYYGAFSRTVRGLAGAILRRPPEVNVPNAMEEMLKAISSKGNSFDDICRSCVNKVMSYGRHGLLADMDFTGERIYISEYRTRDIINWDTAMIDGEEVITLLVLREIRGIRDLKDEFVVIPTEFIRVLDLNEGAYRTRLYQAVEEAGTQKEYMQVPFDNGELEIYPKVRGVNLDYIPFVSIGPFDLSITPEKPPLIDLAYLNIAHWNLSVDYHHGLHLCALPTPYAIGFPKTSNLAIGPGKAWQTDDTKATCGFMEFSGKGLGAVRDAMDSKVQEMAAIGARVIAEEKRGVEAAETARIRQSGETAILSYISSSVSAGLTKILGYVSEWSGIPDGDIFVKLNTDFIDSRMDSTMLRELFKVLQGGGISQDTFLYNLKHGEVLPQDRDIQEEKDLIETEGFKGFATNEAFDYEEEET